ncbi:hypothetical protein REPUB_Repub01dG0112500 [Reevesia pubescens]
MSPLPYNLCSWWSDHINILYFFLSEYTTVDHLSPSDIAIASSISKVLASIMTYPHEVFLKEGLPGFYRGCATNLLRTTPSAVITFTSYEMIDRFLHQVLPQLTFC